MSRLVVEDLEVDGDMAARMDELFASIEPRDHAGQIIGLADAPQIQNYERED